MEYSKALDNEFKRLGFDNFRKLLKTAIAGPISKNSGDQVFWLISKKENENIGYAFIVLRDGIGGGYNIIEIHAAIERDIAGNPEFMILGENYFLDAGPLPDKSKIDRALRLAIIAEDIK